MHLKSVPLSFLGGIFLQAITNGHCRFSRHIGGKLSELMESLEYVQAFIDDLLCISRNSLEDYL
jgi:hypothetical protein